MLPRRTIKYAKCLFVNLHIFLVALTRTRLSVLIIFQPLTNLETGEILK